MAGSQPVFDDVIVSATTLNRRSGDVLDQALERCVTIMRNDQAFALLRRDRAAALTALLRSAQRTLDLFHAIELVRSGTAVDPANEFEWITAFTLDDLKEMVNELYMASVRAGRGEIQPGEVNAIIHEWEESAWALRSPEARSAFDAAAEETSLTEPILTAHE
jgi:hypothetical protein